MGVATISINPRNTSRANASAEDDGSSSFQEEATDMRNKKRKHATNFNKNKKVVRETCDSHPSAEDELSLYGGSDLDEQIDRLMDTTNSPKFKASVRYVLTNLCFSPNDSPSKTMTDVFYFI